jgi:hypothetical protein
MFSHRPEKIRSSKSEVLGLALLIFFGGVDLHSPTLNHSTFETPHPVLYVCGDRAQPEHFEPAGAALAPAHEPVLRVRQVGLRPRPEVRPKRLPQIVGSLTLESKENLPAPDSDGFPSPRSPPLA